MIVEITCPQRLQNGLVVPGKFMTFTKSANRTKIKRIVKAHGDRNNWKGLKGKETVLLHILMLV